MQIYPKIKSSFLYNLKADPIKYALPENDIKQITKEDIGKLNQAKSYKKTQKNIKLEPGDIIRYGRGSYHKVNKRLLEWFGNQRTNPKKLNKLTKPLIK